jgi:D-alanyl-lipoteichoic acid acyltransferase DltB (MBOAT superfamily)
LLLASYFFYGFWDYRFLSLIIFSSFVDFLVAQQIHKTAIPKKRNLWLYISLFSNLGLLAVFKYFNFFSDSFADLMLIGGWEVDRLTLQLILPVGISFYTFQTLSYTIDVYRGKLRPTIDIIAFFTYVSFFPQLVAGPIERASNLIPQIQTPRSFNFDWFKAGILQIIVGLFRKIVIADNLGIYVDSVYGNLEMHNGTTVIIATIFYAFQIYYDFAGYSDIAIGSARLLGFRFEQNFNFPYFSKSLSEFWRRWHISLSSWLKDYLYISLGGNRRGIRITYRNLLLTMIIGGLWHGSSWNFVIWGAIHGLFLIVERFFLGKDSHKGLGILGIPYTFCIVLLAWFFFRATTFNDVLLIFNMFVTFDFGFPFLGDLSITASSSLMLFLGLIIDVYLSVSKRDLEDFGLTFSSFQVALMVSLITVLICLFYSTSENFIYFQF